MATKPVVPPKTVAKPTVPTPPKPAVQPAPKPPSPGSVQAVINRGQNSGYNGVLNEGMTRIEVDGKVIDSANQTTIDNLKKKGGTIISGPGQKPTTPTTPTVQPFNFNYNYMDYNAAKNQAEQQFNPLYEQAVKNIQAQQYQNEMDSGEAAASRGIAQSGLAADALNKIKIASQGQIADANAQKMSQVAALAQQLIQQDQQRGDSLYSRAYQQYRDSIGDARYTDQTAYNRGRDTRADFEADRNYNRGVLESDRGYNRDVFESDRGYNHQIGREKREDFESDRSYNRGVLESDRNYNQQVSQDKLAEYWRQKEWNEMPPSEKASILFRESVQNSKKSNSSSKSSSKSKTTKTTTTTPSKSLVQQFKNEKATANKTPLDRYYESQVMRSPKNYLQDVFQPVAPRDNKNISPWVLMKMMGG